MSYQGQQGVRPPPALRIPSIQFLEFGRQFGARFAEPDFVPPHLFAQLSHPRRLVLRRLPFANLSKLTFHVRLILVWKMEGMPHIAKECYI